LRSEMEEKKSNTCDIDAAMERSISVGRRFVEPRSDILPLLCFKHFKLYLLMEPIGRHLD
jgi:hypothetical protein